MKSNIITLSIALILCFTTIANAQLANDDCFGATPLGTLGVPAACPSGIGAVSTFPGLTNVNGVSEQPYTTLINCQPSNVTPMASPATDVWYSFVNNGNQINIIINGTIQTPNIALYQGDCNGLIGRGCAIGAGGALTTSFDQMVPGQTYYLQISGGDVADQGTFTMALQNTNSCVDCLVESSFTANPLPNSYGMYAGGTTVTFCYTITEWTQQNTNWLHAVIPSFGNGWDLNSITNLQAAATCDGGPGVWQWFNNVNTPNGNGILSGFFFDGDLVQSLPNGDPTDNFGDNCEGAVNWTFCLTVTSKACPPGQQGDNLGITFDTYGDGETGNWTNIACVNDPVFQFNASLACCVDPLMQQVNLLCFGAANGTATATGQGVGPFNYVWRNSSNTIIQTSNNTAGANTVSNLAAGTYTVTVTDQNNGCITTASVTITQPAQFTVQTVVTGASCGLNNGTSTATPQGGVGPYDYVWTDAQNANVQTANNQVGANTVNGLATGTYTVTVTDANGCVATATATIQSAPGNLQGTITASGVACTNTCDGFATVTLSNGTPNYNYEWTDANNVVVQIVNNSGAATNTINGLCAGTYTVDFSDASGCTGSTTVTIITPPPLTVNLVAAPATICVGETTTLTALAGGGNGGPYTYAWTPAGTAGNVATAVVTPAATTNYTVTVSDGCTAPSVTGNVTVTVNPQPVADFTGQPLIGCAPLTVAFTNNTPNSTSCFWNFGNGSTSTNCGPGITGLYPDAGCFDVTFIVTDANGCKDTLTQIDYVCALENVNVNFFATPQPTDIFEPTITFTDLSSGNPTTWDWTFGTFGVSNVQNPIYTFPTDNPGCHDVILTANNANNCPDTDTVNVCIKPNFSIYFPNAFTPNNDGRNNTFNGVGEGIVKYDMWIFNRWGTEIFHTNSLTEPWDGRTKGRKEICQDDVYVYKAVVVNVYNQQIEYVGHVTLIR